MQKQVRSQYNRNGCETSNTIANSNLNSKLPPFSQRASWPQSLAKAHSKCHSCILATPDDELHTVHWKTIAQAARYFQGPLLTKVSNPTLSPLLAAQTWCHPPCLYLGGKNAKSEERSDTAKARKWINEVFTSYKDKRTAVGWSWYFCS